MQFAFAFEMKFNQSCEMHHVIKRPSNLAAYYTQAITAQDGDHLMVHEFLVQASSPARVPPPSIPSRKISPH